MKEAIYTDTAKAERLAQICESAKNTVQQIYNELTKTGCTFTIKEMIDIWQLQADEKYIKNLIVDKKLQAEPPELFGMKIPKHKVSELVEVENMQEIMSTYINVPFSGGDYLGAGYATEYLSITNNTVTLSADYQQQLTDKYCTLFATTQAQKDKAEKLVNIATALNELDGILKEGWRGMVEIEGLKEVNKQFVPDMKEIGYIIQR